MGTLKRVLAVVATVIIVVALIVPATAHHNDSRFRRRIARLERRLDNQSTTIRALQNRISAQGEEIDGLQLALASSTF
jgi:septal ring factor EnvC (AmiA/AmiB activator)